MSRDLTLRRRRRHFHRRRLRHQRRHRRLQFSRHIVRVTHQVDNNGCSGVIVVINVAMVAVCDSNRNHHFEFYLIPSVYGILPWILSEYGARQLD